MTMPDAITPSEDAPQFYGLGAIPVGDGEYLLQVERLGAGTSNHGLMIEADRFTVWLLARGCEFCAHAVKLGQAVRCDHPPTIRTELEDLGVKVS